LVTSPKRYNYQEITRARAPPTVHDPVPSTSDKATLGSTSGLIQEIAHEDGRTERVFNDSRRLIKFLNGTIKEVVPSSAGTIVTVYFANGDVRRRYPDESVEYFYAEVDTWHTTHPSTGAELYHFVSTGQVELHGLHEYKEILFPEGALRRIYPDGREEDVLNHH
jgi:centromere protein J